MGAADELAGAGVAREGAQKHRGETPLRGVGPAVVEGVVAVRADQCGVAVRRKWARGCCIFV